MDATSTTARTKRIRRQDALLLLVATLLGLWLGVAAPAVSPVAPPTPSGPASTAARTP